MKALSKKKKIILYITAPVLLIAIICAIVLPFVLNGEDDETGEETGPVHTLAVVEIATYDKTLPVNKVDYVNSSFKLYNTTDDDKYGFEVTMKETVESAGSVGIRLRGNSTMGMVKKPYRIKFDKKQSMFGSAKNKSWVLLADYLDPSLIKNYSALKLGQIFDNMAWNPLGTHVNVYLNGEYKGVYLLCDQIDEKEGRLGLENAGAFEDGQDEYPFLVEISDNLEKDLTVDRADLFNIKSFITSTEYPNGSPAEIKYPESGDGRPDAATEYITNYVNSVFDFLSAGDIDAFENLVDIDSFIDYVLLNELCSNSDAIWRSIYVSKKIGEKMKFGPVWDFDGGFGVWTGTPDDTEQNAPKAFTTFYSSYCKFVRYYFLAAGESGFNKFADRLLVLNDKIDAFYLDLTQYKNDLTKDAVCNQNLWYESEGLFEKNYAANLVFFTNHTTYLRGLFSGGYADFMEKVFSLTI